MIDPQSLPIGRHPSHWLYRVTGEGEAAVWTLVGAAWPNHDGKGGFIVSYEAAPQPSAVVLRFVSTRELSRGCDK